MSYFCNFSVVYFLNLEKQFSYLAIHSHTSGMIILFKSGTIPTFQLIFTQFVISTWWNLLELSNYWSLFYSAIIGKLNLVWCDSLWLYIRLDIYWLKFAGWGRFWRVEIHGCLWKPILCFWFPSYWPNLVYLLFWVQGVWSWYCSSLSLGECPVKAFWPLL